MVDVVLNRAKADVMLVKKPKPSAPRSFLLPTAGGEHARCAQQYVAPIVRVAGGSLTIGTVVRPDAPEEEVTEADQLLEEAKKQAGKQGLRQTNTRIIDNHSVTDGILAESNNYDAVVVGAAAGSVHSQILFGPHGNAWPNKARKRLSWWKNTRQYALSSNAWCASSTQVNGH